MIYYNQFTVNPEKFRGPQYNISPFSTEWIKKNHTILNGDNAINYLLLKEFYGEDHYYYLNGKAALYAALSQYSLDKDDEVYIITTTGNKYISSCVTTEIEKICKWSRKISDRTRLILVNHEFGMSYQNMSEIKTFGLPIIEDMAMSMFSTDINNRTGDYGDFTIFSLPKFFPIQFGGILKINNRDLLTSSLKEDDLIGPDLRKLVSYYLHDVEKVILKRRQNYKLFSKKLKAIGIRERFKLLDRETPSVFMFDVPFGINKYEFKVFLQSNGVEASVFYGEDSFFIPVHQNLEEIDINFIVSLIQYFFSANK